jgi:hypothetical protein
VAHHPKTRQSRAAGPMPAQAAPATSTIGRRATLLATGAALLGGGAWFLTGTSVHATLPAVTAWKNPSCGCCGGWIRHTRSAGFLVTVLDVDDVQPVKDSNGVPDDLRSCHTAVVDGYVVEGHVPAGDIKRLLEERPAAKGLAAPGMPSAAPGMDGPHEPYEVILFGGPGGNTRFASH